MGRPVRWGAWEGREDLNLLLGLNAIPPPVVVPLNAAELVKFYIPNTVKKPNWVPIWQFFVWVNQLSVTLRAYLAYTIVGRQTWPSTGNTTWGSWSYNSSIPNLSCEMVEAVWPHGEFHLDSTRAHLLVIENIESSVELNDKPPPERQGTRGQLQEDNWFHLCTYPQCGQWGLEREALLSF